MIIFNKLSNWYFSRRALPFWCIMIIDCVIVMFSCLVAVYANIGGGEVASRFWHIVVLMIVAALVFALFFHLFHTSHGIIRYTSMGDLQRISYATVCGSIVTAVIYWSLVFLFPSIAILNNSVGHAIISWLMLLGLTTFLMWFIRITVKVLFESFRIDSAIPVAIYGTKAGGVAIANSINSVKDKKYNLRAFISDADDTKGTYLLGKKVYENSPEIADILRANDIKTVLVSPLKTGSLNHNQDMIESLTSAGIKILMMHSEFEWDGKSDIEFNQLHEVEIEDLLPREKIEIDLDAIGKLLRGRCILITGAAGSIGSEMVRQIAKFSPARLILIDQAETPMHDIRLLMTNKYAYIPSETVVGSITNKTHMEQIFSHFRPEYVFHAAAYKHVPMMEDNPAMAVQNNVYGTRVIADLAVKYGTKKFVMISTDKAVNPTNVMGCSKRICEIYCQSLNKAIQDETLKPETLNLKPGTKPVTQFVTTRFGNVLGSNGSVIPLFKEQIKNGGPVTVTHPDIIRYFMLIPEACRLVLEAGTMGKGGEIFVFDMGKPVRIVDLAKRMIKLSGAKNIEIKFTGLRDGEKLYEEVLAENEGTKPTVHPKIKIATVREYPYDEALKNEKELYDLSFSYDDMQIVRKMKEIVPEYKSKVSKYEVLDK